MIAMIVAAVAASSAPTSDHGWICHLSRNSPYPDLRVLGGFEILKLRLQGERLDEVGEKTFGRSWKVIVNNQNGLVAVDANASLSSWETGQNGRPKAVVNVETIVINKAIREITDTVSAADSIEPLSAVHGECVPY